MFSCSEDNNNKKQCKFIDILNTQSAMAVISGGKEEEKEGHFIGIPFLNMNHCST